MPTIDVSELLRPGLLDGVSILVAAAPPTPEPTDALGRAVADACEQLGASVSTCGLGPGGSLPSEQEIEELMHRALAGAGGVELLAVDAASLFARAHGSGEHEDPRAALGACLDASWSVTHAVVNRDFLSGDRGGRIVYLAPPPDAGEHADAARAGLENLARTLSIEWARHGVTVVTIAPGAAADGAASAARASEVAALTAYLASPAGAYFSGCLLDLRGAEA